MSKRKLEDDEEEGEEGEEGEKKGKEEGEEEVTEEEESSNRSIETKSVHVNLEEKLLALPTTDDEAGQVAVQLGPEMEQVIQDVARDGSLPYKWALLRNLFRIRTRQVLDKQYARRGFVGPPTQSFEGRRDEILGLLDGFVNAPPFTLQRLAELLSDNTESYYRATHKLLNGMEKLLAVYSTIFDFI